MILKKDNVEKITKDAAVIEKLKKDGFKEVLTQKEDDQKPDQETGGSNKTLEEMTADELKTLAKEQGKAGYSSLKKEELIELLKDVE